MMDEEVYMQLLLEKDEACKIDDASQLPGAK